MVWPNPKEVAVLTVDGAEYSDWKSVEVVHALREHPYYKVRFTCSEGLPLANNFALMRIAPGQWCTVKLGGVLAVSGFVYSRQVFYDARNHYVEIQAGSDTMPIAYASIISKTGELKNVTAEQAIRSWVGPLGINFSVEGGSLPQDKFPRLSSAPGETVLERTEETLRQLGNIPLTSRPQGGLVAAVGPIDGGHTFVEGQDIKEGREVIFNPGMMSETYGVAHDEGDDQKRGAKITHAPFLADIINSSWAAGYAPLVTVLELPTSNQRLLSGRNLAEKELQGGDLITVIVTVQGWMQPEGGLWKRNATYYVKSPMLVMDGRIPLRSKTVRFMQDDHGGTRTVLELCNELALGWPGPVSSSE